MPVPTERRCPAAGRADQALAMSLDVSPPRFAPVPAPGVAPPTARRPPRVRARQTIVLLALVIAVALVALVAFQLSRERALAVAAAGTRTEQQARLLEAQVREELNRVDLSLAAAAGTIASWNAPSSEAGVPAPAGLRRALQQLVPADRSVRDLVLLGGDGAIVAASSDDAAAAASVFAAGDAFRQLQQSAAGEPLIGVPLHSSPDAALRPADTLPVAIRLARTGTHASLAMLALVDLRPWQRFYDALDAGANGFATLFLRDGWIVVRSPVMAEMQSHNWGAAPMFRTLLPQAETGTVRQVVAADGVERIYSYRALADRPLVATFGVSLTDALAGWREQSGRDAVGLATALLLLAGATGGLLREVDRREAAERSMRESEARFRSLTELSSDCYWRLDASLRVVELTGAAAGRPSADAPVFIGRHPWELPLSMLRDDGWHGARAALEDRRAFRDVELHRLDAAGMPRWIAVSGTPVFDADGRFDGYRGVGRDITERKRSETALETQRLRTKAVVDSAMDGVITVDVEQHVVVFNSAAERMFRCRAEDVLGKPLDRLLPMRVRASHHGHVRRFGEEGVSSRTKGRFGHVSALRADGEEFPVEASISRVEVEGQPLYTVTLRDVTVQRRHRQQLMLLETCVEHLNDMVIITSADATAPADGPAAAEAGSPAAASREQRIVFVNQAFERRTGYRRDEVLGRSPRLLQGPRTQRAALDRIGAALAQRQPVRCELVNYTKDGDAYWVELDIVPVANGDGRLTHWVAVERDIGERKQAETDRRELEQQLRESQKMESIGTLAGGIAHDFNNILASILGNAALAGEDIGPGHPARAGLRQIDNAARRARDLVQQILAFSRRQPSERVLRPLRPLLVETVSMLRSTLPAMVTLQTALSDEPIDVRADTTQIQQVLMNLCTNAWHALDGRSGSICVGLERADGDAATPGWPAALAPGRYAHVWVRDSGSGMDAATRERIFEPFFTTKPAGLGTGLGLSVVHGIVSAHQGAITVDSRPGAGSTFHVYLPAAPAGEPPAAETGEMPFGAGRAADVGANIGAETGAETGEWAGAGASAAAANRRHVLYVDDDEAMRLMIEALLGRAGFRVTGCAGAREAIGRVRAQPTAFDVVVSDFNMPELSGLDLARELARIEPVRPIVITSGYLSPELRTQALSAGVCRLLNKQNSLEELVPLIRELLVAPDGRPDAAARGEGPAGEPRRGAPAAAG